jgi:hypothetical protein
MMGPFLTTGDFAPWISLLAAFIIGMGFGFALEQAGFSSSRKLAGMFYGYDATVLKVFFTAAITAMVGARILNALDLLDMSKVFHNHFYIHASLIGGVIMGAGFIMGGFCPGTGISALAIGKMDALVFLIGGAAGAFLFAETYGLLEDIHMAGYRGPVKLSETLGISDGLFILIIVVVAVAMFWLAEKAEQRFARPDITREL